MDNLSIVALAGVSATGKTTLARRVREAVGSDALAVAPQLTRAYYTSIGITENAVATLPADERKRLQCALMRYVFDAMSTFVSECRASPTVRAVLLERTTLDYVSYLFAYHEVPDEERATHVADALRFFEMPTRVSIVYTPYPPPFAVNDDGFRAHKDNLRWDAELHKLLPAVIQYADVGSLDNDWTLDDRVASVRALLNV